MTVSTLEPSKLEIHLTLWLGLSILKPYYREFVKSLKLVGDERVLDFGSGSGVCSRHIAEHLKPEGHLDCIDISHRWITTIKKTLRKFTNVSFFCGHINDLRQYQSKYDVIVLHYVLHDIPPSDRKNIVQCFTKLIKPGGQLKIREPNGAVFPVIEMERIVGDTNFEVTSIYSHKTAIGAVNDFCFIFRNDYS